MAVVCHVAVAGIYPTASTREHQHADTALLIEFFMMIFSFLKSVDIGLWA